MNKFHGKNNINVSEIALKVKNIDKAVEFYKSIMGFKVLENKGKEVILTTDGSTPIITLMEPNDVVAKESRRTGLYHFAILLPSTIELGLLLRNIKDQGYPIVGGSDHGVSEALYLQDPDDNGIEVYVDKKDESWEWAEGKVEMLRLPLDYNRLLHEAGHIPWDGLPTNTIMGHIHLHVGDLKEASKFYREGLGLDLVSEIPGSALFFSYGGYHHHIAINIWNGRGVPSLPPNSVGMKYYTLIFPNEELRKEKIKNLGELGYKVFKEDGSSFVTDPSMNLIRLVVHVQD